MKPLKFDDPHELVGVALDSGDADLMAECLVEEYLLLGWSDSQLMSLFTRPCYRMTHRIYLDRGHEFVATLIEGTRAKWTAHGTEGRHA